MKVMGYHGSQQRPPKFSARGWLGLLGRLLGRSGKRFGLGSTKGERIREIWVPVNKSSSTFLRSHL